MHKMTFLSMKCCQKWIFPSFEIGQKLLHKCFFFSLFVHYQVFRAKVIRAKNDFSQYEMLQKMDFPQFRNWPKITSQMFFFYFLSIMYQLFRAKVIDPGINRLWVSPKTVSILVWNVSTFLRHYLFYIYLCRSDLWKIPKRELSHLYV